MKVQRIHHDGGSHIEPALNESWSRFQKLQWHAAVVAHDTGLIVSVFDKAVNVRILGVEVYTSRFGVRVGAAYQSPLTFDQAWTYLNGAAAAAEARTIAGVR